jgi:hypothetical protein
MSDEKKSYQVTDRRHGAVEAPEEAPSPATSAPAPEQTEPNEAASLGAEPPPVSFTAFIMSLAAQASLLLGGVEGAPPDLKGAKWLISILEMLRDKTDGRRTAEETEALEAMLYELRMDYVQRARAGGA